MSVLQQHIHQLPHFTTHPFSQLAGLTGVVFQQIAMPDQVQPWFYAPVRIAISLRFTHAEELHKAGVEAFGKAARPRLMSGVFIEQNGGSFCARSGT